jgi:hypothetical protein
MGDEIARAESSGAQNLRSNGHKNGTCSADLHQGSQRLCRRVGVHQRGAVVGYPDASLFAGARAIAPGVWRGRDGPCGCPGSVWLRRAGHNFWPAVSKLRCSSAGRDRSGCR